MARGKVGWFLGLILGTFFGVLFAPRKGKELRARMKADIKRGKFGIAPLKEDMKKLGEDLCALAVDLYESPAVQEVVIRGRTKMHELSDDIVREVGDFKVSRISPLAEEAREHLDTGKRHLKRAKKGLRSLKKNVRTGFKIGKKAVSEITDAFRKENGNT